MKNLNEKDLRTIVRELIDAPRFIKWLQESVEANHLLLDEADGMEAVRGIQGENRCLRSILATVPKDVL